MYLGTRLNDELILLLKATGKVWAKIPDSDHVVVDRAVDAAKKAFLTW